MSFSSWLRNCTLSGAPQGRTQHRLGAARFRPRLEALEDRWLPSQIGLTVSSLADSGPGTLRAAILTADAGSPSDNFKITFSVSGTIDLQSPLPDLNNNITIQGPGASSLTVERAAGFSFSSSIITVGGGQTASLSGLTIANGNVGGITNDVGTLTVTNCAIVNNSAGFVHYGGGINNIDGTLTVRDCTLSGNSAASGGGGIDNFNGALTVSNATFIGNSAGAGGAMFFEGGAVAVRDSVFTANSATEGGAMYKGPYGTLDVRGSTFSANTASDSGGGIYNFDAATLQQCTLSANSAGSAGGGIFNAVYGTLAVKDSTVLNNAGALGADIYNLGALTQDDSTVGVIGP
jgi:hypothetical protein